MDLDILKLFVPVGCKVQHIWISEIRRVGFHLSVHLVFSVYWIVTHDGSATVTFLFSSWDFPASLQERLEGEQQWTEVYINGISPYCKAQLTMVGHVFPQNKCDETILSISSHVEHLLTVTDLQKRCTEMRCLLEYNFLSVAKMSP